MTAHDELIVDTQDLDAVTVALKSSRRLGR